MKECEFCFSLFNDLTKNQNRTHCGSLGCKKEKSKQYRDNRNIGKYKLAQIEFKKNNPNYLKQWREKNREQDKKLNREYKRNRLANDIDFKIAHNLRSRLNKLINGYIKSGSAVDDLGCSIEELKKHLENQFQEGMSWDNYGEWHIDHIKPLAKYNLQDKNQLKEACHYINLQPLWAKDNLSKGDK